MPLEKMSIYLANKVKHSYGYISNVFSEHCLTTIENFTILHRIERAKSLLLQNELSLTEISYKLSYSSVAHLSAQFKKITGLTAKTYCRIVNKRKGNS